MHVGRECSFPDVLPCTSEATTQQATNLESCDALRIEAASKIARTI